MAKIEVIMKKFKRYKIIFAALLCFPFLIMSCEDKEEIDETFSRLFMPPEFQSYVNGTTVSFYWTAVGQGLYSVEISRDSLSFATDLQVFEIEGKNRLVLEDLYTNTRYSARVKAVSTDENIEDSNYQELTFATTTENIFYATEDENIGTNSVLLKWVKGKNVSKIVASTKDQEDVVVDLDANDIASGQKLIEGLTYLQDGCPYVFTLYLNDRIRGTETIETKVITIEVDQIPNVDEWHELGTYYFLASPSGSYLQIRNDNTNGYVVADAIKLSREGYDDIIMDSEDTEGITITGYWGPSTSSTFRIGANYRTDGNTGKGSKSVKYSLNIPATGLWKVYMYWAGSGNRANNVPVDIFAGDL